MSGLTLAAGGPTFPSTKEPSLLGCKGLPSAKQRLNVWQTLLVFSPDLNQAKFFMQSSLLTIPDADVGICCRRADALNYSTPEVIPAKHYIQDT